MGNGEWEMGMGNGNGKLEVGNGRSEMGEEIGDGTFIEHRANIDRKSMEHPLTIIRTYLEGRKCSENSRNLWKSKKIYKKI